MRTFQLFTLLLSLCLAGCVHYAWVRPGGDPSTFNADHYACLTSSMQSAPPVYNTYAPPPQVSVDTYCRQDRDPGHIVCRDVVKPRPRGLPVTTDLNAGARNDLYNACMNANGWFYQAIPDPEPNPS